MSSDRLGQEARDWHPSEARTVKHLDCSPSRRVNRRNGPKVPLYEAERSLRKLKRTVEHIEPRIYRIEIRFNKSNSCLQHMCADLEIEPENATKIDKDGWGICQQLELWFQEIEEERIVLHIQKPHGRHSRKYVEDLQNFFKRLKNLEYVEDLKEIGY